MTTSWAVREAVKRALVERYHPRAYGLPDTRRMIAPPIPTKEVPMLARMKAWKSTSAGVAVSGVVYLVLESLGCKLPSDWMFWALTLAPAVIGVVSKK